MGIPIVIISYNNHKYVKNTIEQIIKTNKELEKDIIIIDNNSSCINTQEFLKTISLKIIHKTKNNGPFIDINRNVDIYNSLPDKFILTDPDLEFNGKLPPDFINILDKLSDNYKCQKIGFALDITDYKEMYDGIYITKENKTIFEWELQFWNNKIENSDYELYRAPIDTTFCLINKNGHAPSIRIAGNFTAKHLPWYKDNNKVYNIYEKYNLYTTSLQFSTISKLTIKYIQDTYIMIKKNKSHFFIKNDTDDPNLNFWKNSYHNWEQDTFNIFDKYLNKNKIFIDIGAWIGTTCIYASQKSKHVYAIEADIESIKSLEKNCKINSDNITIINKALYNENDIDIKFGKNLHLNNSKLNDSTSQIHIDNDTHDSYSIKTITMTKLLENYNIDPYGISLIKVDIEGGEEFILEELFELHKLYNVTMYISFHYSWWKDKNLDRFEFLSEQQKLYITSNPFGSLLINLHNE